MLMALAKQGIGITMLPETLCAEAVRNGELEVVLPEWRLPQGIAHAVFASRRGLLPAVRVFIDFLAERMPALIEESRLDCQNCEHKSRGSGAGQRRETRREGRRGCALACDNSLSPCRNKAWRAVEGIRPEAAVIDNGEMAERFKAPVLKTGEGSNLPWVRIPPLPPLITNYSDLV